MISFTYLFHIHRNWFSLSCGQDTLHMAKFVHAASENAYSYWLHVRDLGYGFFFLKVGVMAQSERTIYFFKKSYKYQALGQTYIIHGQVFFLHDRSIKLQGCYLDSSPRRCLRQAPDGEMSLRFIVRDVAALLIELCVNHILAQLGVCSRITKKKQKKNTCVFCISLFWLITLNFFYAPNCSQPSCFSCF